MQPNSHRVVVKLSSAAPALSCSDGTYKHGASTKNVYKRARCEHVFRRVCVYVCSDAISIDLPPPPSLPHCIATRAHEDVGCSVVQATVGLPFVKVKVELLVFEAASMPADVAKSRVRSTQLEGTRGVLLVQYPLGDAVSLSGRLEHPDVECRVEGYQCDVSLDGLFKPLVDQRHLVGRIDAIVETSFWCDFVDFLRPLLDEAAFRKTPDAVVDRERSVVLVEERDCQLHNKRFGSTPTRLSVKHHVFDFGWKLCPLLDVRAS